MFYRIDPEQSHPATQADGASTLDSYLASVTLRSRGHTGIEAGDSRLADIPFLQQGDFLFRTGLCPGTTTESILFVLSECENQLRQRDPDHLRWSIENIVLIVPDAHYEGVMNEICDALGVKGIGQNGITVRWYHEAERIVIVNHVVSAG